MKYDQHFVMYEGSDFRRKSKKLSFKNTISFILSMAGKPIREELLDFFHYSNNTPSASALIQARSRISSCPFQFIFNELNKAFPSKNLYKGYHLIAVDGSEAYESIVTNLNRDEFNIDDIKDIYNFRWGIKLSFRDLKYSADLCALHAKKRESIQQEIWARIILYNISFIVAHHVVNKEPKEKDKNRKYSYTINKKLAIHHCRYYIQHRKRKGGHPPDLETLVSQEILPIRPNRKCERNVKTQSLICFNYRFSKHYNYNSKFKK